MQNHANDKNNNHHLVLMQLVNQQFLGSVDLERVLPITLDIGLGHLQVCCTMSSRFFHGLGQPIQHSAFFAIYSSQFEDVPVKKKSRRKACTALSSFIWQGTSRRAWHTQPMLELLPSCLRSSQIVSDGKSVALKSCTSLSGSVGMLWIHVLNWTSLPFGFSTPSPCTCPTINI